MLRLRPPNRGKTFLLERLKAAHMLSAPPAEACFTGIWASVALRQKGLTGRHRSDAKSLLCVRPPPSVSHPTCAHSCSRLHNVHHVHISTNLFDYGPTEEIRPAVAVQVTARPRPPEKTRLQPRRSAQPHIMHT